MVVFSKLCDSFLYLIFLCFIFSHLLLSVESDFGTETSRFKWRKMPLRCSLSRYVERKDNYLYPRCEFTVHCTQWNNKHSVSLRYQKLKYKQSGKRCFQMNRSLSFNTNWQMCCTSLVYHWLSDCLFPHSACCATDTLRINVKYGNEMSRGHKVVVLLLFFSSENVPLTHSHTKKRHYKGERWRGFILFMWSWTIWYWYAAPVCCLSLLTIVEQHANGLKADFTLLCFFTSFYCSPSLQIISVSLENLMASI